MDFLFRKNSYDVFYDGNPIGSVEASDKQEAYEKGCSLLDGTVYDPRLVYANLSDEDY